MAIPGALNATQVGDLVQTTLRDLGKPRFTEIASTLQKHTAMRNLLKKNRVTLESGFGLQWDVMVGQTGAAANVGLYNTDVVNDVDVMTQATADWRFSNTNYPIENRVLAMNREPSRIVNFVQEKRIAAMISFAELMEANFWGPPVALSDTLTPWGVNTWIVKNATQGFNGGAPSGYTSIGLNPTTYPNWQNWTDQYTAVSQDDFVRKLRKACTFTEFEPIVDGVPTFDTGEDHGLYTNYGVIAPLEEVLMSQNDNMGTDIAKYDGQVHFRRIPVMWIPKLEPDTTNPIYGIQWGVFKTFILQGWWLKETHIPVYPMQHTISAHFIDCAYQWVMRNRRCHFVISTGTTYPA